jgi:hypothetical protein
MELRKTKTGSVPNGYIDATFRTASSLLTAAGSQMARLRDFANCKFTNIGDTALYVANMDTGDPAPGFNDAVLVMAGQEIPITKTNTGQLFIASTNAGGNNAFQLIGDPL